MACTCLQSRHREIYTAFRQMWGDPASGSPVAWSHLVRDKSDLGRSVGVRDKAELYMIANMNVVELQRPSRVNYLLCSSMGRSLNICRASRGAIRCRLFERIETSYLHLSHIVTMEASTRVFTYMHVTSRNASSPGQSNINHCQCGA